MYKVWSSSRSFCGYAVLTPLCVELRWKEDYKHKDKLVGPISNVDWQTLQPAWRWRGCVWPRSRCLLSVILSGQWCRPTALCSGCSASPRPLIDGVFNCAVLTNKDSQTELW